MDEHGDSLYASMDGTARSKSFNTSASTPDFHHHSQNNGTPNNSPSYRSQYEKKRVHNTGLSTTPVSLTRSKTHVYNPTDDIRPKVKKSASVNQHYSPRGATLKHTDGEKIFKDIDGNIHRHASTSMTLPNSASKRAQFAKNYGDFDEDAEYAPISSPTNKSDPIYLKLPENPLVDSDYTDMTVKSDTVDGPLPQKSPQQPKTNITFPSPVHRGSDHDITGSMTSRNSLDSVSSGRSSVSSQYRPGRKNTRSPVVSPIVEVPLREMDRENLKQLRTHESAMSTKSNTIKNDYTHIPQPSPSLSIVTQTTILPSIPGSAPNSPVLGDGRGDMVDIDLDETPVEVIEETTPRSMHGDNPKISFSESTKSRSFCNIKTVIILVIALLLILGLAVGCILLVLENQAHKTRISALEQQLADVTTATKPTTTNLTTSPNIISTSVVTNSTTSPPTTDDRTTSAPTSELSSLASSPVTTIPTTTTTTPVNTTIPATNQTTTLTTTKAVALVFTTAEAVTTTTQPVSITTITTATGNITTTNTINSTTEFTTENVTTSSSDTQGNTTEAVTTPVTTA